MYWNRTVSLIAAAATAVAMSAALIAAAPQAQDLSKAKGAIRMDGSSTVYPISEAVGEQFYEAAPGVKLAIGRSGTGGGFKKFTVGETDLSNASRPIKKSEMDMASSKGIEFVELPIAYDGLTMVVNKSNTWVKQLTIEQIKKIFNAATAAKTWKEVDPSWPAETIKIYAPGTDSGTFDYFKEVIIGKDGQVRADMSVSEDDNQLVRGIEGDKNALGFFGYYYFESNKDKLRDIPVVNPKTNVAVEPTAKTIENGTYAPFSRPLFIYVNKAALAQPHIMAFSEFYLANAAKMAKEVGYVPLPAAVYDRAKANLKAQRVGTQFTGPTGEHLEGSLVELYK